MDFGHGFLPRIDARNYKAVGCLPRDGPEAVQRRSRPALGDPRRSLGAPARRLNDRAVPRPRGLVPHRHPGVALPRPPNVPHGEVRDDPYAPVGPLAASDRSTLNRFVEANLETQATLGASAYLLPGVIPANAHDDVRALTLTLLETAQAALVGSEYSAGLVTRRDTR